MIVNFKKALAFLMAVLMLAMCLAGCGDKEVSENTGFKVTIKDIMGDYDKEGYDMTIKRWESLSEVPIEWEYLPSTDTATAVQLMFSTGDYPEVLLGQDLQTADISNYAATGILLPLDEYINEKDTPNIYKMFQERPKTKAANYLPDGHMYSLPALLEFKPDYLENRLFINKVWLDKLGLEIPKTIDELKKVLHAFKTQDPNGNGKNDEIPMSFNPNCGYAYPEALLSCWGVATKYGSTDGYCTVQNGEVKFAPMMDEWKEMIKFYNELYSEGLLDIECFTHNADTYHSKLNADTPVVGFTWYKSNPFGQHADDYVAIEPLRATDKDPVWRIHPGIIGNRNMFCITKACKNPKAAIKWIDNFFAFDQSVQNYFGNVGKTLTLEDETYKWNALPEDVASYAAFIDWNKVISGMPGVILSEDYGTRLQLNDTQRSLGETFAMYEPYLDTETWPRPYYSIEETTRYGELTTDIFNLVGEKKAKWIVGTADIDAEWDSYKASLEKMGIAEMIKINQTAYDRYLDAIK